MLFRKDEEAKLEWKKEMLKFMQQQEEEARRRKETIMVDRMNLEEEIKQIEEKLKKDDEEKEGIPF